MTITQITQNAAAEGKLTLEMTLLLDGLMWNPRLDAQELQALRNLCALLEEGYVTVEEWL